MRTRTRNKYKEKLRIRENPKSKISSEERLKLLTEIIIERIIEVNKNNGVNYGKPA